MRSQLHTGPPPRNGQSAEFEGAVFNLTPAYVEGFLPHRWFFSYTDEAVAARNADAFLVVYWVQLDTHLWTVCINWQQHFDFWAHLLTFPSTAKGMWRAVEESCPTFTILMQRSDDPLQYEMSLARINDADTNQRVWILGSFFGNVVVDDLSVFLQDHPWQALLDLVEVNTRLGLETIKGPMAVPKAAEYVGAEAQRAEFTIILETAPKIFKGVVEVGRLLGS